MRAIRLLAAAALAAAVVVPSAVRGAEGKCPRNAPRSSALQWPAPPERNAFDVVHFGEAHWNEGQGPKTMPILVQDVVSSDPDLVLFSSDIADIGSPDRLSCFRIIMKPLDDARLPWFDSPGNHDRVAIAGPGGVASGSIDVWRDVFSDRPAPWGDAAQTDPRFIVPEEPDDGPGASTHYYFDYGPKSKPVLRVVVLDNSQQSLTSSDLDQYPAVGPGQKDSGQLAFLHRVAADAERRGLLTWVVMHQPTQDPRDPSNVHPASVNHTMGKGLSADNSAFDALAMNDGVDAVLLGHIQGNTTYEFGDARYFIDGGGGGSPYALREVGTDTGYYYGFRILRLFKAGKTWDFRTYFVPLIDTIEIHAPKEVTVGESIALAATAVQPFDPDLPPRLSAAPNEPIRLELRPPDPNRVDYEHLPELAFMWETSDPSILEPVGGPSDPMDDPAFDPDTMTTSGSFEAVGTGTVTVTISSGTHTRSVTIEVAR